MDQSIFSLRRTFDEKKPQTLREGPLPPDRQVPRSRAQCMQFQLTNKPPNGSNSSRVLQPEGLRRLPPYAIDFKSAENLSPTTWRDYIIFSRGSAFHWQIQLSARTPSLARWSNAEGGIETNTIHFQRQRTAFQKRHLTLRVHGLMGKIQCLESKLPHKDKFYRKLNDEHITDEEYAHAQMVWEIFRCKTLGDYHDLYLKTELALLTDVFENYQNVCQGKYGLDPAHYYTSPGLSLT